MYIGNQTSTTLYGLTFLTHCWPWPSDF